VKLLLGLSIACLLAAENWPMWRGASGLGTSTETDLPTHWSATENVKWRIPLPEPGNSTPVIWGDSIFLTQARKADGKRSLMSFDRTTGRLRWERSLDWNKDEPTHPTNPYASASPATDGTLVVAWFGSAGLVAYDFAGKELWRRDLGIQRHTWGYGTSPVLYRDWVFLNFGPGDRAFLIALNKRSGKTVWQKDLPAGEGKKMGQWEAKDMYGSWSMPTVFEDKLLLSQAHKLVAYQPATGKELWTTDGLGDLVYPSPIYGEGVIVAAGGFRTPTIAVKPGGELLWRHEQSKPLIGSGVIRDGHLYQVDIQGIAHCFKLTTGEEVWSERLPGKGSNKGVWSSPVLVGDRIYVMNKSGETFLFHARPRFELLGINSLEEETNSSVVISGGEIFLRTYEALWCIRK
jgi:outer membrane protein assembly factor BamB